MKFKNPLLETKYVNIFGETMILVLDAEGNMYAHHNDCTDDFVPMNKFEFILNDTEQIIVKTFIDSATAIMLRRIEINLFKPKKDLVEQE